ncbi:helix-turn-helix domain-containing protein [Nocardia pseudovaccinii]|uniref:helix-turn-helix domain-containing protein n=1 Tax=Nocardia pseudovaccinii TaxID=189540 RepID=UPI003D941727
MAKRREDQKARALRESRTLNPRPEVVSDERFASSEFFDARDMVQVKYEMVRRVEVDGVPVARAAAAFGLSRQTFYQAAAALAEGGPAALVPGKPGPKGPRKLTAEVIDHLEELLATDPARRPGELAERIEQRFGIRVHPRSVERALERRRTEFEEGPKSGP